MKPIIQVEKVSKQYKIGVRRVPYTTLRETIVRAASLPFARFQRQAVTKEDKIWALKDVSFEVNAGETVGIIGRNGAGKSTLLKILSRITEPTAGQVELYGRMGSLLEVGTGFHPELTGKGEYLLHGAILGMKRAEIELKFDEIVAFAEVEKFIDTPVKHYSSGMYMRLAFAVAAHLDPEIMIVDEVLSVGDSVFQKKCLGKLAEVGAQGRTVLFVSHNVPMVLRLCSRVVLLENGRLVADGSPQLVTQRYLHAEVGGPAERIWRSVDEAPGDSVAKLRSVRVLNDNRAVAHSLDIRQPVLVEMEYLNLQSSLRPTAVFHFINEDGICLFATNEFSNPTWNSRLVEPGMVRAACRIPGNFLAEGTVFVVAAVVTYNPDRVHFYVSDAVSFQIEDHSDGDGVRRMYGGRWPGVIRPMIEWQVEYDGRKL